MVRYARSCRGGILRKSTASSHNHATKPVDSSALQIPDDFIIDPSTIRRTSVASFLAVGIGRSNGVAYAIKTYSIRDDSRTGAICRRECDILRLMKHPHVQKLHHAYEDDRAGHMVLDLHMGVSLCTALIVKGRFREMEAQPLTSQMLRAIEYIHQLSVVHRDIKTKSWVYDTHLDDAPIKLCDFGFARRWDQTNRMHTRCGTAAFMAPEMLEGSYTNKCDLWSHGVTVLAVLTCRMPCLKSTDIMRCKFAHTDRMFMSLSESAKRFISQLLVVDDEQRMSATESLQHKWMAERESCVGFCEGVDASVHFDTVGTHATERPNIKRFTDGLLRNIGRLQRDRGRTSAHDHLVSQSASSCLVRKKYTLASVLRTRARGLATGDHDSSTLSDKCSHGREETATFCVKTDSSTDGAGLVSCPSHGVDVVGDVSGLFVKEPSHSSVLRIWRKVRSPGIGSTCINTTRSFVGRTSASVSEEIELPKLTRVQPLQDQHDRFKLRKG